MKQLSVIIVNYNVRHFLEQCLLSVQKAMEGIEGEVFVVDNNSVDGSQQMLEDNFPDVIKVFNKDNPGFSKANNQGIRMARGKYVLLLNPDTVVEESTFHKCLAFMDSHADAGALGVKMIDGKGKFLPESKRGLPTPWVAFYKIFGLSSIFPRSKKFGKYHLGFLDKNQNHEVEVLSGAFMLLRQETLDPIGLLDEDFFMYGEDIDLSYRVNLGGWKNYYFSETQIIHYKGESTKKGSLNYVKVFYNAMIIFARKHFSTGRQKLFITLIRMAVYFRAVIAICTRIFKRLAFPGLEAILLFLSIYGIKEYWEYMHKIPRDGDAYPYPPEFDYLAAPVYTLVFILFLAIAGAYRKPYKIKPIQQGAFAGFVAIATVSYIFPGINFSRMIVGLSAVAIGMIAIVNRGLINLRKNGNFFFTEASLRRVVIVGEPAEADRISSLIRRELNYPVEIEGIVCIHEEDRQARENVLGSLQQLDEIVRIYKIDEVVFANKSISSQEIMSRMSRMNFPQLIYKIVPPDTNYLVGPQVIHDSLFSQPDYYNLGRPELQNKKRVFDAVSSFVLLLTYPLHFWLYRRPGTAFSNLWRVLKGNYHLVGYIQQEPKGLPGIKKGLLNMMNRVKTQNQSSEEHSKGLDRYYARSYSLELDIEILFKGLRNIGGKK